MKTFRQFLKEAEDFRARILPAIRNMNTGKVMRGKRGWTHNDIAVHHNLDPKKPIKGQLGYWDPNKRQFHPKHGKDGLNIDSTHLHDTSDMMSNVQRMRKYGTFEEEKCQS